MVFLYSIYGYFSKITYLKLDQKIEMEVVNVLGKLDVAQHEDPKIKDLITRVTDEGQWRIKNYSERIIYLIQESLSLIIASSILLNAKWWTLPLLLFATIPELIVSSKYGRDVWSISSSESEQKRFFWNLRYHFTYLPNLLELKLFQNLSSFKKRLFKLFRVFLRSQIKNEKKRATRLILVQGISQSANALVGIFFIYQVLQGNLQIGTLTFLIATIGHFRNSLSGFFINFSSQYQDSLFVNDFFKLQSMPPVIDLSQAKIKLDQKTTPKVEFKNVSFKYPGTDTEVLTNLNLIIEPGTKLALVGSNGAGKTTFVKLLCRFYDPTQGQILVNDVDLKHIDLDSWYFHLGLLFQEYAHYHFKVKDIIGVGRWETKGFQKILQASKHAESDAFIQKWKDKYNQQLGRDFTNGKEPSIGQWQKLALARVFYRNPSIYILDEPTASLDAQAEAQIFTHLENLAENETTILISHRFSTVRKADQIVVIENGTISEKGTHRQLLLNNQTYAKLFNLQAKDYQN